MNARAFSMASRALLPSTRCLVLRTPMQRRFASSEQQPSNLSQFYKTFTRPVAKVLLMAFFTYQLAYWAWVKLEQDEIMAEREAYIAQLEDEVAELSGSKTAKEEKRTKASREHDIQNYQQQLMQLERRNEELRAALAQAENEGKKEQQTIGQKKTSPWWKVW